MAAPHETAPTLSVQSATKRFAGVTALDDVSVDLWPGEVHALVGENGAGKSTLIKLITGVYQLDAGEVRYRGGVVHFHSPRDAQRAGIQTIYQEVHLAPQLSVARNVFLGREPKKFGALDLRRMQRDSVELLRRYGIVADVRRPLGELGLGVQQMVAVARAVSADATVVIMDEPTSSLEPREVDKLLEVVALLKEHGVAIVYVSHKLEEIFRACDKVTVLRDGKLVSTTLVSELNRRQLISRMLGRDVIDLENERTQLGGGGAIAAEPVLEAKHMHRKFVLDDISLVVRPGEVVGLAGLLGSGRSETAKALFGALPIDSGSVMVDGTPMKRHTPASRLQHGVAMLPEDRKAEGLIPGMSIRDNIGLASLDQLSKSGFVSRRKQAEIVDVFMKRLRIKASGPDQLVRELSGGNQQKVLLGRWLMADPKVLLMEEPTRGVDVGAKAEIYRVMNEQTSRGVAIVLVSSDLPELVEMSDRVIVMREGRVVAELAGDDISQESVLHHALESATP